MLSQELKQQVSEYFTLLQEKIVFKVDVSNKSPKSEEMKEFLEEIQSCDTSDKVSIESVILDRSPSFKIENTATKVSVEFSAIPMGHEFTTFVLACLQVSGRPGKLSEELFSRIKSLSIASKIETYVSLSCHNCPDVAQAFNLIAVINPLISHTCIDGGLFEEEVTSKSIMAVPAVFKDGEMLFAGKASIEEIVAKLEQLSGTTTKKEKYLDVLVIGAGPAGASAAIYCARKGLSTGILAKRMGGQVSDTLGIENFIATAYTEGPKLVKQLEEHVKSYPVDAMTGQEVSSIEKTNDGFYVESENYVVHAKAIILATGANWRNLGVQGEQEFKTKGVAYCPHCDGPFFKGKDVAVVGGGNSGVEAAIDLAGIVNNVTLLEFGNALRADMVLQTKLKEYPNIKVILNAQTTAVNGTTSVESLSYLDRTTNIIHELELQGVFVQIGLLPNTSLVEHIVARNKQGEILVDKKNQTNVEGLFAAGDCTDVPYKQIIVAMGEGAKAGLGVFEYLKLAT